MFKKCSCCKELKYVDSFYKNKISKDGLQCYCKDCQDIINKKYNSTPKGRKYACEYASKYQKENKQKVLKYQYNYYKKHWKKFPWIKTYWNIVSRCNYKSHSRYKYYGARGIKCLITKEELKILWFRDKAYNLDKPSIDRKNPDGNYTLENCRYIEMSRNISRKRYRM